jgi:hypothetical protein
MRGRLGSIGAQLGAAAAQIVATGFTEFGSSSVPTRTTVMCGRRSDVTRTGVPHFEQNHQCIKLPLSAMFWNSRSSPSTVTAAVLNRALTVPLPPPRYWQRRHQHERTLSGDSPIRYRTALHKQPPVTAIAFFSRAFAHLDPILRPCGQETPFGEYRPETASRLAAVPSRLLLDVRKATVM